MKSYKLLFFIILLLLFTTIFSQEKQELTNEKNPCDMNFARLLVEQQVADGKNTEDTGKRIKILIRSANFLWDFDEEVSRDYLTKAFDIAEDRFNELGFERKKDGTFKGKDLAIPVPDYRLEVIRAIAKKDRIWADKLVKKVVKQYEKDVEKRKGTMDKNSKVGVLMSLANDSFAEFFLSEK